MIEAHFELESIILLIIKLWLLRPFRMTKIDHKWFNQPKKSHMGEIHSKF
jgi:hypothetical protein